MSHSVIYVLFKSSKKAAPGIKVIRVKDHLIYPVKEQDREPIYTHTHTHVQTHIHTESKHYDAIFGARKREFTISMMQTAVRPLD